jgi:hypothetical protein
VLLQAQLRLRGMDVQHGAVELQSAKQEEHCQGPVLCVGGLAKWVGLGSRWFVGGLLSYGIVRNVTLDS